MLEMMNPHNWGVPDWYLGTSLWLSAGLALLVVLLWLYMSLFAPISPRRYALVGIFGDRGSGKSFLAVTYLRRYRHFHPHVPVWTNLNRLELPGDGPVYTEQSLTQIMAARDGVALIDEMGIELNAQNWAQKGNQAFAEWIAKSRKVHMLLLYTAHTPATVNKRVRDVTDESYLMRSLQVFGLFRAQLFMHALAGDPQQTTFIPKLRSVCRSYDTDCIIEAAPEQSAPRAKVAASAA